MKSNRRRRGEWLGGLVCGTFALAWVIAGSTCIYIWVCGGPTAADHRPQTLDYRLRAAAAVFSLQSQVFSLADRGGRR